jgi:hypothetical protein
MSPDEQAPQDAKPTRILECITSTCRILVYRQFVGVTTAQAARLTGRA